MNPAIVAAIERARQAIQERTPVPTYGEQLLEARRNSTELILNPEQQAAVDRAIRGDSFCLIGSAGTGKTTTTHNMIEQMMALHKFAPLEKGTKFLNKEAPGVALIAYTRRAVRNIAKKMPADFKAHCLTYHKLVEYEPEEVETQMPDGTIRISKPFLPQRNEYNPLPSNLRTIIVDEASMLSIDFYNILMRALPDPEAVQFIFIGDINQIPPIYGDGILGLKLNQLPVIELTTVYRQALESPIIALAIQVKDNNISQEFRVVTVNKELSTARGKVTLIPWKKKLQFEDAEHAIHLQLQDWITAEKFNVDEDVILCPWGKSFGTINMNKSIGTALARREQRDVFEVLAGFEKHYFTVGDRVMYDKMDAIVTKIARNTRYIGKPPQPASKKMDYWGWGSDASAIITDSNIDDLLDSFADATIEDRKQEASHAMTIKLLDEEREVILTQSAQFNKCDLGYAMTVHKAQGSEWRRVVLICHDAHAKNMNRELLYTAITRASEELVVIMPPTMLGVVSARAKIKGKTLAEKIAWFKQKHAAVLEED